MIFRLCLLYVYNNNQNEELITSENQGITKLGNMEESEYKKDIKRNPNIMINKFGNSNLYFFIAILHYAENLRVRGDL